MYHRITLDQSETQQASFELSYYDLAIWSVENQRWQLPDGDFTLYVGRSAFDDESLQSVIPADWLPGSGADIYSC